MKRLFSLTRMLLLCATAALSACAAPPPPVQLAEAPQDKDVICQREEKLGTLFPKVRCRSAQQIEAERAEAKAFGDAVATHPSLPQEGGK
ncbi:MAG: hypothetical protein GXC94_07200 [Comamonadaceae bacterium]|jgi:hypothetical protein|nr:hypothetical protein [Comamonadaceae bacterium]